MKQFLTTLSLSELAGALRSGDATSLDAVEAYTQRIAEVDPLIRSVLTVNPDANSIAAARSELHSDSLLAGIPILLKDNINTGDAMLTTAGSVALATRPAPADAFIVDLLRRAGSVILGKTNLSEWANMRSTHSSSGWSSMGGQTNNPHALDRTPSGSSSGSAAAVAAELCAGAIGTETDGSIISPASMCGIVGFKPSMGMVSRTGIVPISNSQDTAGPMTRTVMDAAIVMAAIAVEDPNDASTLNIPRPPHWLSPLTSSALQGIRVAFLQDQVVDHADLYSIRDQVEIWLKGAGAEVIHAPAPVVSAEQWVWERHVLLWELVDGMKTYLAHRGATTTVHSLADIVQFNREHANQTMPWFGQEYFEMALQVAEQPIEAYRNALQAARTAATDEGLDRLFDGYDVELIVGISNGPAPVTDHVNGEHGRAISLTSLPAVAGYPHLTVPAGMLHGLPIGASFIGRKFADANVLAWGHAFEEVSRARVRPRFIRSVPDGTAQQ